MAIDDELKSLISLFEDDDSFVIEGVNRALLLRGPAVLDDLNSIYHATSSPDKKGLIMERIQFLKIEYTMVELDKMLSVEFPDLERGIFLLTKLIHPDIEELEFQNTICSVIKDMLTELSPDRTALENIQIFNHIFYERVGFRCEESLYPNEESILLPKIVEKRVGTPVCISLLYFLFGRYVGLEIYPICFYGGFIPAYIERDIVLFYIDISRGGELFSESKLRSFLEQYGIDFDNTTFEVKDDRALLQIYTEVLHFYYKNKNNDITIILDRVLKLFGGRRLLQTPEGEEDC